MGQSEAEEADVELAWRLPLEDVGEDVVGRAAGPRTSPRGPNASSTASSSRTFRAARKPPPLRRVPLRRACARRLAAASRAGSPGVRLSSARVFVATPEDGETVVGYYAIAAAQVAPEEATERALRGQPQARPVPAILLARRAVDERHQGVGLGRSLLRGGSRRGAVSAHRPPRREEGRTEARARRPPPTRT